MENRTKATEIYLLSYHDLKTIDGGNNTGQMGPSGYNPGAARCFHRCLKDAYDWARGFLKGFVGN